MRIFSNFHFVERYPVRADLEPIEPDLEELYPIQEEIVYHNPPEFLEAEIIPRLPKNPPNFHSKRKSKSQKVHKPLQLSKPQVPVRYRPSVPKEFRLEPTVDDTFYDGAGNYIPQFYHQQLWQQPSGLSRLNIKQNSRAPSMGPPPPPKKESKSVGIDAKLGDESLKILAKEQRNG